MQVKARVDSAIETQPVPRARRRRSALALALCAVLGASAMTSANAQLSVGFAMPGLRIGINVPSYPDMQPVPGYPVYYAPQLDLNLFFYDGLYWSYIGDQWYSSSWYNGPWDLIGREFVPVFVLRVPVRYYRQPPIYFGGWARDDAPRWGDRWGRDWERRREGWDRWDHRSPPIAPLPMYQRDYRGDRYPRPAEQRGLRDRNYDYRPQDAVTRQHFNAAAARPERAGAAGSRSDRPPAAQERAVPDYNNRQGAATRPDRPAAGFERPAPGQPTERRSAPPQARDQPPNRPSNDRPRAADSPGSGRQPWAAQQAPAQPRPEPRQAPAPARQERAGPAPQQAPQRTQTESPRREDRRDDKRDR